jgi:ABC-2 type transport system ATP-binding protein
MKMVCWLDGWLVGWLDRPPTNHPTNQQTNYFLRSISMSDSIRVENLTKTYYVKERLGFFKSQRRAVDALRGVNLTIKAGELFGLLGPNGAGKTTLIKCLTTLLVPSGGHIWVNGHQVGRQDAQVRASLGCLLNGERSLYWKLTGRENLEYFAALHQLSRQETAQQLEQVSRLLDLEPLLNRSVETLSSGQKMTLAFARVLMNRARILILDEPTNALDVPAAQRLRRIIKTLHNAGYTIILTTHQMAEVEALCERVAIVDRGTIIAEGTIAALKAGLKQNQVIRIEGIIPPQALDSVRGQPDVLSVASDQIDNLTQLSIVVQDARQSLPALMQNLLTHQALLEHISPATVTLEDVFMAKTGRTLSQDTN